MRYAFYISGRSGRLLKAIKQFEKNIVKKINLVVSDFPIEFELKNILTEREISMEVIDDKKLVGNRKEKNTLISNFILDKLVENKIDYMFSFGSHILSGDLLKRYNYKLINFHPAILPMFPGIKSIDQAVEYGNVLLVGNTAHFIDAGMDTGKIIMQTVIPLKHFTDTKDYDVVLDLQIEMLNKLINIIDNDRLHVKNDNVVIDRADYSYSSIFPKL